jgi:hypothetical protein
MKIKKPWRALQTEVTCHCSYRAVFLLVFCTRIVPRRLLRGEEGDLECYRWKKATFQFHDAYRSCISWRGGLASRQDERKEHQLAVSATRRGFPVATSVGPTCYCARLPIIPIQETLALKHGCVFEEKWHMYSSALFKNAHVSSGTAARHVGISAECLLKSLRPSVRPSVRTSWGTSERVAANFIVAEFHDKLSCLISCWNRTEITDITRRHATIPALLRRNSLNIWDDVKRLTL